MNRIFTVLTFTLLSVMTLSASSLTEMADSAYSSSNYGRAAELYVKAASEEGTSATLYYNLGNAYYRQNKPGLAILNYERALRLDPTMEDARANLEFVNSRITDRPGERGTFVGNALDSMADFARSDTWAWLALVSFALALGCVALYLFTTEVTLRKVGFFGVGVLVIVTCFFVFMSLRAASRATDDNVAIITSPSTILSTSPRKPANRNEEAMLLHEGTRVEILDSVREVGDSTASLWLDVNVDNQHRAWLNAADAQRVVPSKH